MSKATKVIRITLEVYEELAKQATGFETPNDVISRLIKERPTNECTCQHKSDKPLT